MNEISNLKDTFTTEMTNIRAQIEKSMNIRRETSTKTMSKQQTVHQKQPSGLPTNTGATPVPNRNNSNNGTNRVEKTAFIAGDDLTRVLSRNKISVSSLDIKIKSHVNGRQSSVKNTFINMSQDQPDFISNADAVVLHVGTNDISDGETPERIISEFKGIVDTVRNINSGGKIIVSSVLPRRNDKLANKVIDQTNLALRKICEDKSCHYLDNYPLFCKNGMPDTTFYKDNMNLNAKGGKVLSVSIRQKTELSFICARKSNWSTCIKQNRTEFSEREVTREEE